MHIDVIDTFEGFERIKDAWRAVYVADPEAQIFLSHQWLEDWLQYSVGPWCILGVRPDADSADYAAFLPLRVKARLDKDTGHLFNEVYLAGGKFCDYAGVLCRPEAEETAIPALAAYVKRQLNWGEFALENLMMSDRRRRLLLKPFDRRKFAFKTIGYLQADQSLDHGICPAADLPDSWDDYLGRLSSNNRQKIRRLLRKVDADGPARIVLLEGEDQIAGIDAMLEQWVTKWAPRKGEKTANDLAERNRQMLRRSSRRGRLFLPVFLYEGRAVATLATLIDPDKRTLSFLITGRDESFSELPSGYLLHAFSIRHAIANGFRTYDFLRGNEPYKYHFATSERRMHACRLSTSGRQNLHAGFDPRCLDQMVEMVNALDDEGETAQAEAAYRQIVEAAPDHALALYRLGRLFARQGEWAQAIPWLKRSVDVQPGGDNAWRWLARAHRAEGDLAAAAAAWAKVTEARPEDEEAERATAELLLVRLAAAPPTLPVAIGPQPLPAFVPAPQTVPVLDRSLLKLSA